MAVEDALQKQFESKNIKKNLPMNRQTNKEMICESKAGLRGSHKGCLWWQSHAKKWVIKGGFV